MKIFNRIPRPQGSNQQNSMHLRGSLRWLIPSLTVLVLLSSCATTNYPTPSSSSQQKHIKKSHKKYGTENPKNLRIKSNYRIKG